jgi:hypothetical protein
MYNFGIKWWLVRYLLLFHNLVMHVISGAPIKVVGYIFIIYIYICVWGMIRYLNVSLLYGLLLFFGV